LRAFFGLGGLFLALCADYLRSLPEREGGVYLLLGAGGGIGKLACRCVGRVKQRHKNENVSL
jgi:hypothetical protein